MRTNGMWTCGLVLAAVFLAGCSGGRQVPASGVQPTAPTPVQATPVDGATGTADEAGQVLLEVKMRPQAVIEPTFRTTSLARPTLLAPGPPAIRRVSDAGEVISVAAGDYDQDLGHQNVEAKGDYTVFDSPRENWEYDTLEDAAYCTYCIDLAGYTGTPTLSIVWDEQAYPILQDEYWVAIANYELDRWDFFEGPLDQVITLGSLAPYTSDGGYLAVLPIVIASARILVLHGLKLGAAEVRATGLQEGEVTFNNDEYRDLFIGELPASCDLAAQCAPVGDQLTWGACTAFAAAQGAYNHELGTIYGGDWDLTDPAFQLSPKYIYVESGKDPEHVPSPYWGRRLATVVQDLCDYGCATELNAPYNLEYDDDWSEEALADAAVLRADATRHTWLPSTDGITEIKFFLAGCGNTVYMSTNIDEAFSDYEAGQVWAYTGPKTGSHAMCIVGYDDSREAFKVRNSWGTDWGDGGHCWIAYSSLLNEDSSSTAGMLIDEYSPAVAERFLGEQLASPPPVKPRAAQGTSMNAVHLAWESLAEPDCFLVYRDDRTAPVAVTTNCEWVDPSIHDGRDHTYWVQALYGDTPSALSIPFFGSKKSSRASIKSFSPTMAGKGQLVTFEPEIKGWGPLEYAWDFGGGATPNTSSEGTPTVLLGDAGSYQVSLTITDAFGSSYYYRYLTVVDGHHPICRFSIEPEVTRIDDPVAFDAEASYDADGRIVLYEWDWEGDGTYDEVTTTSTTTHTYTTCSVEYEPQLRVTDGSGLSTAAAGHVEVIDYFNPPVVSFDMDCTEGDWQPPARVVFDAAETFDYEDDITLYEWDLDGDGTFELSGADLVSVERQYPGHVTEQATLRVSDAEGLQDEDTQTVRIGIGSTAPGWAVHGVYELDCDDDLMLDLDTAAGHPVVMVVDSYGALHYFAATTLPGGPGDWQKETLSGVYHVNGGASMVVDPAGRPLVAYYSTSPQNGLYYAMRDPVSGWEYSTVWTQDPDSPGRINDIAIIAGKPAIACSLNCAPSFTNEGLYYVRGTAETITETSQWEVTKACEEFLLTDPIRLCEVAGLPAVAYSMGNTRLFYAWAGSTAPTGEPSWTVHDVDLLNNPWHDTAGLIDLNGEPLALCSLQVDSLSALRLARGTTSQPGETADWNFMASATAGLPLVTADLALVGGVPWAAWLAGDDPPGLYVTWADDAEPATDGDWTTGAVSSGDYQGVRLTEVDGQPALVFYHQASGWLYYATPE